MHITPEDTIVMTKKDYVALAAELHLDYTTSTIQSNAICQDVFKMVLCSIANVLQRDNNRFDRSKFLSAVINGTAKKGV